MAGFCTLLLLSRNGREKEGRERLTVLFVEQDLELILQVIVESQIQCFDGVFVRQFAVHETDATWLLHNLLKRERERKCISFSTHTLVAQCLKIIQKVSFDKIALGKVNKNTLFFERTPWRNKNKTNEKSLLASLAKMRLFGVFFKQCVLASFDNVFKSFYCYAGRQIWFCCCAVN